MEGTVIEFIFTAINAIGTFLLGIVAILTLPKMVKKVMFKNETLFGREAEERYKHLKSTAPNGIVFEPQEYKGGNKQTPQFEVEKITFDPQTMPPAWKGHTKSISYYYKENGTTMEHCWLLK